MRVYVDANPYIDVFEDRKDPLRDLAEFSFQMFRKIRERKCELVVSDWLEFELKNNSHLEDYKGFVKMLEEDGVKILRVETIDKDLTDASKYDHPDDALHAVLAKKMNADMLMTNNDRHYLDVKIIEIKLPCRF